MNFGLGGKKHGGGVFSGQILFLGILLLLLRKTNSQPRERWRTPRRTGSLRTRRRRRGALLQQGYVYHFSPPIFFESRSFMILFDFTRSNQKNGVYS
jgi:hypothetical protein